MPRTTNRLRTFATSEPVKPWSLWTAEIITSARTERRQVGTLTTGLSESG